LTKPRANPAVIGWADRQPAELFYATAIGEAEILYGLTLHFAGCGVPLIDPWQTS
jgi:hypothetical protein